MMDANQLMLADDVVFLIWRVLIKTLLTKLNYIGTSVVSLFIFRIMSVETSQLTSHILTWIVDILRSNTDVIQSDWSNYKLCLC
jgi:hypothetical protein